MKNPLSSIVKALGWLPKRISREVSEEVAEKTTVAVDTALGRIELASPVLADLLAGNEIELQISVRIRAKETTLGPAFKE